MTTAQLAATSVTMQLKPHPIQKGPQPIAELTIPPTNPPKTDASTAASKSRGLRNANGIGSKGGSDEAGAFDFEEKIGFNRMMKAFCEGRGFHIGERC